LLQTADLIDRVVDETDDMELVEGDLGVGQIFSDAFGKGLRQVGADFGNGGGFATMSRQVRSERGDGGRVFTRGRKQNLPLVQINKQRDIGLATPEAVSSMPTWTTVE
jgi:hypothetical protein